jgi:chemotaxis protein CheZ
MWITLQHRTEALRRCRRASSLRGANFPVLRPVTFRRLLYVANILRRPRRASDNMTADELKTQWGELFGALSNAFAAGDEDAFIETLDRLGEAREKAVYRDLRELSGSLRFALDQFRLDSRLATLAGKEVPDAKVRLDHVLKLTEAGAHRTLDLVERSCPLADKTAKEAAALVAPLQSVRDGTAPAAGLEQLLSRVDSFLAAAQRDSDTVRGNLTEVLMAQSYQDLSGQIIRGVITLVAEVERTLAHFAVLAADNPAQMAASHEPQSAGQGFGPAIPGLTTNALGEQNDVDALLADLGM